VTICPGVKQSSPDDFAAVRYYCRKLQLALQHMVYLQNISVILDLFTVVYVFETVAYVAVIFSDHIVAQRANRYIAVFRIAISQYPTKFTGWAEHV